jgi:hypothetical protein
VVIFSSINDGCGYLGLKFSEFGGVVVDKTAVYGMIEIEMN